MTRTEEKTKTRHKIVSFYRTGRSDIPKWSYWQCLSSPYANFEIWRHFDVIMTSFSGLYKWRHCDVIFGQKNLKKIMEIAEIKSFISYVGFFLLSLLEKKLQRFSIFKNNPGRIDPPLPIFLGPRFLGHPIPDFGRVFCIRTGLNSCSLAKKAGSEIAEFSEKIRKILGGGSVRPPPW